MFAYLVSLECSAGTYPVFASSEGAAAQRTAVALSQDFPEALIATTPLEISEISLTDTALITRSSVAIAQADGLVELLAFSMDGNASEASDLDLHFWPDRVRIPSLGGPN